MCKRLTLALLLCVFLGNTAYAADTKTTALVELTDVIGADVLFIIDDIAGTATSKKITVLNLFDSIDTSAELLTIVTDETGTGVLCFATSPVFTGSITISGADASPDAAGEIQYDSTVAGMSGGALRWYDNDSVRLIVDLETDASNDDYVVAYDAAADGFYMKADATGTTAYDDIADPDASGSISFDAAEAAVYTSSDDEWVGVTISNTQADNAGDTELLTLAFTDDGDTNCHYLIMSDAAGTQQLEFIQSTADIQITITGDLKFVAGGGDVDFADENLATTGTAATGILTVTGVINTSVGLDAVGAVDMDYGSADVTDHTFTTDSTGTAEIVLPAGSIDGTEILDDTIDSGDYAADSIDNEHINWADISNLGDQGAVTLAGLATTLTITDNESTAENNALIFTSAGDLDGGNLGLECDGTAYYTPSTGTITTTQFVGGGAGVTSVDAITGDSATAFFDAGTIEHEYGGLEADINAYTGLVAITGGNTAEVDSKSELEGHIADVANFAEADGDVYTGNADFGGADFELPQASPGVPDADGEIEVDFTDGTLVLQHGSAHAELGASTDVVVAKLIRSFGGTIFAPDGVNDVMTVKAINSIEFPHGIVVTAIYLGIASNTTYTLTFQNFDDFDTINAGDGTIDAVTYTADTTGEVIDTSPTYATIAAGQIIMVSIPSTDVDWIHFEIYYYEPAA